ncbi:unnamed protein product, partial [marine sediment metagenome]
MPVLQLQGKYIFALIAPEQFHLSASLTYRF